MMMVPSMAMTLYPSFRDTVVVAEGMAVSEG
jgi:hypothetical protein